MPALVNIDVGSPMGTSGQGGKSWWPFSRKNEM
jgi:hypothetical protein